MNFYSTAAMELIAAACLLLIAGAIYGEVYVRGRRNYCSKCDRRTAFKWHRCAALKGN